MYTSIIFSFRHSLVWGSCLVIRFCQYKVTGIFFFFFGASTNGYALGSAIGGRLLWATLRFGATLRFALALQATHRILKPGFGNV